VENVHVVNDLAEIDQAAVAHLQVVHLQVVLQAHVPEIVHHVPEIVHHVPEIVPHAHQVVVPEIVLKYVMQVAEVVMIALAQPVMSQMVVL
jgi:hypothetical protein